MEHYGKKEKSHDQKVRSEALKKLGWILLVILIGVNTFQLARFGEIVERVDMYNKGVIDELGGIRQDVMTFGNDLNEIRGFLLLPIKEYSFSKGPDETQDTEEVQTTRTESALYAFLGGLTEEQTRKANAAKAATDADTLLGDASFHAELEKGGLKTGKREDNETTISVKIEDGTATAVYSLVFDKNTAGTSVQSSLGTYACAGKDLAAVKTELLDYFGKNKEQALRMKATLQERNDAVAALPKDGGIGAILKEKKLKLSGAEETGDSINWYFENESADRIVTLKIKRADGSFELDGTVVADSSGLTAAVTEKLKAADASTYQEKLLKEKKTELEGIFAQETFVEILKNNGLSVVTTPREEYNKLLYDVNDAAGKTVFSFAIEISSGAFKIIKDNQETDLYSILDEGSKKKP
jgi:hypothetical protein